MISIQRVKKLHDQRITLLYLEQKFRSSTPPQTNTGSKDIMEKIRTENKATGNWVNISM